jgi:isochorismate pyruvate lyase
MKVNILFLSITILFLSSNAFASVKIEKSNLTQARSCPNLTCVRNNIDTIDSEIVKLIGLRLTFVKRAGKLKKGKQAIHDQVRENQIILKVTQLASKNGYPGFIAAEVYKTLLTQANIYEQEYK